MKFAHLVAGATIVPFSLGDALAAAWGKTGKWWWLVAMLLAGNAAWILFAYLNKTWPLATVGSLVNIGLMLFSVILGVTIFKEKLKTLEWVAIAIGFTALGILFYARVSDTPPTDTGEWL